MATPAPMTLSDLPEDVLLVIMSSLRPQDLARLCAQDRRLRTIVSGSTQTWRSHAEQRWPALHSDGGGSSNSNADHYCIASSSSTPWYTLYRERETAARLAGAGAPSLGTEADRLRLLVARQLAGKRRSGFLGIGHAGNNTTTDQIMMCAFALGTLRVALTKKTTNQHLLPGAPDFKAAEDALALWLCSRPENAIAYARDTAGLVSGLGGAGGGVGGFFLDLTGAGNGNGNNGGDGANGNASSAAASAAPALLEDVLRRRSAVQFLLDWFPRLRLVREKAATEEAGDDSSEEDPSHQRLLCPSVASRLQQEATWVDARLRPQAAAATAGVNGGGSGGGVPASLIRNPPLLMRPPPVGVPLTHGWWWWVARPPRAQVAVGVVSACGAQAAAPAAVSAPLQQRQPSSSHHNHRYHDF